MTTLLNPFRRAMFLLATLMLLCCGGVQAAEFVIPNGDIASLKAAINAANTNNQDDTIRLAAGGNYVLTTADNSTYEPTGLPVITADNGHRLTVVGNGATIRRGSAQGTPDFRIFCVVGAVVDIFGLTVTNGRIVCPGCDFDRKHLEGGGIYSLHSTLTLTDCTLSNNFAERVGGAISSSGDADDARLTLTRCTLSNNVAEVSGGAIESGHDFPQNYPQDAPQGAVYSTLSSCTLSDNKAGRGGAISTWALLKPAELTLDNCLLERNIADSLGGGISAFALSNEEGSGGDNLSVRASGCTFRDNVGTSSEGRFEEDPGDARGGGLLAEGTVAVTLTDCLFDGNSANPDNHRSYDFHSGGGVAVVGARLSVNRCTFAGNVCTPVSTGGQGYGGAIGIADFVEQTFLLIKPNVIVTNSTFTNNISHRGGGITNISSGNVAVLNCTFSGNTSSSELGNNLLYAVDEDSSDLPGNMSLGNNIFNNTSPGSNIALTAPQGFITSLGYNLSNDDGNGLLNQSTDILNTNPLLGPLQDNGGATHTMALLAGSPAIDRIPPGANVPTTDQRGTARPQGSAADIGAYERANTPPTIQAASGVTRQQGSPAANQVIATVNDLETARGELQVSVTSLPAGITVNGLTNNGGQVTASVAANCAATPGPKLIGLQVSDGGLTAAATLTVIVAANTPPALAYAAQSVIVGSTQAFNPSSAPADNGQVTGINLRSVTPSTGLALTVESGTGHVTITSATRPGSYTVLIRATDNCGATTDASVTVTALCPAITLSPASLPNATVNTAYNQSLSAGPAGTTYSFVLMSGALPAGLTLNPNGTFSGAPAQSGVFNFRITMTGWGACSGFRDYTLVVNCTAITVNPATLPGGAIGANYSQTITAAPAGAYNFSVTSGALPLGLTLNAATGALTGAPAQNGTFNFRVTASAGGCAGARNYTLNVGCPTIALPALANATTGVNYSGSVAASPAGSYSYSVTAGSLPPGLTLNASTGAVTGFPAITGNYTFTVRAQTPNGCSGAQSYSFAVACPAITLSSLPTPTLNVFYNQTVTASPAGGNYSYAVTSGALPAGLTLNATTGAITGTPTAAGTFNFTLQASRAGGCAGTRSYSFTLSGSCPTITLPALTGGAVGQMYSQSVAASPSGTYIYAVSAGSLPPGVTLYSSGMLFGFPAAAGTYNFTITAIGANACTVSRGYSVAIQ